MSFDRPKLPGDATDPYASWTPEKDVALLKAVKMAMPGRVRQALADGAYLNCCDDNKDTPLIHAARTGALEVVQLLLEAGADPLRTNKDGQTALVATWPIVQELSRRSDAGESPDPAKDAKSAYELGLIGGLLYKAETAANEYAVASCKSGVLEKITVRPPLKFKPPAR